jgi:hypothetical protein
MKMMALVLIGIVLGLGLVFLPTLGTTSFFFGGAAQATAGEGKNITGSVDYGNGDIQPAAAEGYSVYRSISESPTGPFGVPAAILALGVALAAGVYLITKRTVP